MCSCSVCLLSQSNFLKEHQWSMEYKLTRHCTALHTPCTWNSRVGSGMWMLLLSLQIHDSWLQCSCVSFSLCPKIHTGTIRTGTRFQSPRSWRWSCQVFEAPDFQMSEMMSTIFQVKSIDTKVGEKAQRPMSSSVPAAAEQGCVNPTVPEPIAGSWLTHGTWTIGIHLNYTDYLRDVESVHPAHFPEPLQLRSCGEHNGLNYSVWTSRAGPGRQELTSPHLLHACDPRLGWELIEASGRASGSSAPAGANRRDREGKPCLGPRAVGDAQGTQDAPPAPARRAAREDGEGSESPRVRPPCCEAARPLSPGTAGGPRCHRRGPARRDATRRNPHLRSAPRSPAGPSGGAGGGCGRHMAGGGGCGGAGRARGSPGRAEAGWGAGKLAERPAVLPTPLPAVSFYRFPTPPSASACPPCRWLRGMSWERGGRSRRAALGCVHGWSELRERERGQRLRVRHAPPAPRGARRPAGAAGAAAAAAAGGSHRHRPLPCALPLRRASRRLPPPGAQPAARAAAAGDGAAVSIDRGGGHRGGLGVSARTRPPSSAPGVEVPGGGRGPVGGRTLRGGSGVFVAVAKREVPAARCVGREGAAPGAGRRASCQWARRARWPQRDSGPRAGCGPEGVVVSGQADIGPGSAVQCFERGRKKVLMTFLENLQ